MSRIQEFEDAAIAADGWVVSLAERLGWRDLRKVYLALMAALHALRDVLPPDEAVHLAAQLPPLLRGFYYDGWHSSGRPLAIESRDTFVERIQVATHRDPAIDAEKVARAVFAELAHRLSPGELEGAKAATPKPLHALWPS